MYDGCRTVLIRFDDRRTKRTDAMTDAQIALQSKRRAAAVVARYIRELADGAR
jgi:hypothetical protein